MMHPSGEYRGSRGGWGVSTTVLMESDKVALLRSIQEFLTANNFFSAFCASIVFKAESKPEQEEKICFGGFSSKTKSALFRGSKMVLFKSKTSNLFF